MGAHTPKAFERIAEYCDGWLPGDHGSEYNWAADIKQLREAEKRFGRNNLSLSMTSAPPNESRIKKLADFGFERLIFAFPRRRAISCCRCWTIGHQSRQKCADRSNPR